MKHIAFPMAMRARKGRQSMALIITLAILAILSILLVSFVSMASLDRGATKSYAQSLPADQIALGGLDEIVSQFQAEIADPALSMNSVSISGSTTNNLYVPLYNTNAVPQRTAPTAANQATLLSYSGLSLYTAGAGITNYSSPGASTQTASLNGRSVSSTQWEKPMLTTSTANFPVPSWILMTRTGPQAFSSYNSTVANSAVSNGNYVVGRYAYIVYDTSGLLDANVAGYPSGAVANAPGKGFMPWADLTQLSSSISQTPDVDNLITWRNASTASPATAYVTNVYTAATNNGFTRVAPGDTTFLSRQELIKYAQTQNTDLTNALPYLTTFSRELNGPTWGPTTNAASSGTYAYVANQYAAGSFNPRIPNPRVQTAFTRANGLTAAVGEPLVKYRFPLDKLALLQKFTGTSSSSSLTAADIANIQKYFGLDLASDANGPSFRHWNYPTTNPLYVHNSGTSGATGIMSLSDVAAVSPGREPDFFELLQAGILSGSLGVPGVNASTGAPNPGRSDQYPGSSNGVTSFVDPDDKTTLQIMRIGANIIDQWGSDNWPTTITYTPNGGLASNVEGIKDLPYPFATYLNMYAPNWGYTGTTSTYSTPLPPFDFYLYFELWNPHQMPSSPNLANYPTNFRFNPYNSTSLPGNSDQFLAGFINSRIIATYTPSVTYKSAAWFYYGPTTSPNTKNGVANAHTRFTLASLATNGIPFSYSPANSALDYREPSLAQTNAPTVTGPVAPWNGIACLALPALTNFPAASAPSNQGASIGFPTNTALGTGSPDGAWQCQYYLQMVMPVQYEDLSGNWHTYSTFLGMDDQTGAYTDETGYYNYGGSSPMASNAVLYCTSLAKSDPRTFRFGTSYVNGSSSSTNYNVPLANSSGMVTPVSSGAPFEAAGVAQSTPYRLDMWAANNSSAPIVGGFAGSTTTVNNPYYPDVDGVQRQGDAANSYKASPVTSPLFTGSGANRPVILNRPFNSVGEMGYAYRDMPWKTLDLFSANSADSGLLDLFTLNDSPILAGRVNPNTPYPQVLAALISGAAQSTINGTTVSSANALTIAQAIHNTTAVTPFATRADMVNNFMTNSAITSMSAIKTEDEAVIRSLAESSNTRTWTFLIDIIAQSGRYPASASSLNNFVVEGERHYWLHVSIDRYTGQVVDKQLEAVNE